MGLKHQKESHFSFNNVSDSSDESNDEDDNNKDGNDIGEEIIEKIPQPPFFRTAVISRTLYPSKCYMIPANSSLIEKPLEYVYHPEEQRFSIPKMKDRKISFVGVDAVVYYQYQPTTSLVPCSKEECESIFNKTEREAVIIVEDEETRRNDTLLEEFDDMEDDHSIPVSRLRQLLHNNTLPENIRNEYISENSDVSQSFSEEEEEEEEEEAETKRKVYKPEVFTFDQVSSSTSSDYSPSEIQNSHHLQSESFPPFGVTPVNKDGKIESIPRSRDSLSDNESPPTRLSLNDLQEFSYERSKRFTAENLRSPRLSDPRTPRFSNLKTPRCLSGSLGAATVENDTVQFFQSYESTPQQRSLSKKTQYFDFSSSVIKEVMLNDRVNRINSFCNKANKSIVKVNKVVSGVMKKKNEILQLHDLHKKLIRCGEEIDKRQDAVEEVMERLASTENQLSMMTMGYVRTNGQLDEVFNDKKSLFFSILSCYGWVQTLLKPTRMELEFCCSTNCMIELTIDKMNARYFHLSMRVRADGNRLFQRTVNDCKLLQQLPSEIKYYCLYDCFLSISFACILINESYLKKL